MPLDTTGLLLCHSEEFICGLALDWPTRRHLFTDETCVLTSIDVRHSVDESGLLPVVGEHSRSL